MPASPYQTWRPPGTNTISCPIHLPCKVEGEYSTSTLNRQGDPVASCRGLQEILWKAVFSPVADEASIVNIRIAVNTWEQKRIVTRSLVSCEKVGNRISPGLKFGS